MLANACPKIPPYLRLKSPGLELIERPKKSVPVKSIEVKCKIYKNKIMRHFAKPRIKYKSTRQNKATKSKISCMMIVAIAFT